VVTVKNLNTSDVTVFANINGQEQRLGTVTSQQTANFELDWGRIGPSGRVSMVVNQIGSSGTYRSGAVTLRPGSQVTVQCGAIAAELDHPGVLAHLERKLPMQRLALGPPPSVTWRLTSRALVV
jgi:hypothetical protein